MPQILVQPFLADPQALDDAGLVAQFDPGAHGATGIEARDAQVVGHAIVQTHQRLGR